MVNRYISTDDVVNHLELGSLNEVDDPKLSLVDRWVTASEEEVDGLTGQRWDLHTVDGELISPDCQTNEFFTSNRPVKRIFGLEFQNGDEWDADWVSIPASDYRVVNASSGRFRTKDYYWMEEGLRVSYECGYELIPFLIKELTTLLVEKRYVMSRLGIAAAEADVVSVASIRLRDKSNSSLRYRIDGLQREIDDRLNRLKNMKSRNFSPGFVNVCFPNERYRC